MNLNRIFRFSQNYIQLIIRRLKNSNLARWAKECLRLFTVKVLIMFRYRFWANATQRDTNFTHRNRSLPYVTFTCVTFII
jgi:hypothetical protein